MEISRIALACTASLTSARALRHGTEYIASVRFITTPLEKAVHQPQSRMDTRL